MKYTISQTDISPERIVMQNILDNEGNIINHEPTDEYEVDITLGIKYENDFIPPFSKTITVRSNNSQTGFEVDIQRQSAIETFLNQ